MDIEIKEEKIVKISNAFKPDKSHGAERLHRNKQIDKTSLRENI